MTEHHQDDVSRHAREEARGTGSARPWWAADPLTIVGLMFIATAFVQWTTNDDLASALPFGILGTVFLLSGRTGDGAGWWAPPRGERPGGRERTDAGSADRRTRGHR